MTVLVRGAKRFLGAGDDVGARVEGLNDALTAARGRLDDELLDDAAGVVARARERLRLSAEHTIVALAGATGSGKSSLFNRLADLDLAAVGVRRPTTSWTLACAWAEGGAEDILHWMGIPARHQVARTSQLDAPDADTKLRGLILLDLPDHDSTELSHHLEVDRLVQYADLLVWVLDPQKYADAAVHDRYLRPLATHADVMLVVLNHIDEIRPEERETTLRDLRRLLLQDQLADVPVLATSAVTGEGVADLKGLLAKRIRDKGVARERLAADVGAVAQRLAEVNGSQPAAGIDSERRTALDRALADAAGVPVVVRAVERAVSKRTRAATGWLMTRWLGGFRKDPLTSLHLERDASMSALVRSSVPQPANVHIARVDVTVRNLAAAAAEGLTPPWAAAVRRASLANLTDLHDSLDQAVVSTDLGVRSGPPWWARLVNAIQWVLFVATLSGVIWLAGLGAMGLLQIDPPQPPAEYGIPIPTLLVLIGVVLGLALAFVSRLLAGVRARTKARRADRALRAAISQVAGELVVAPIQRELIAYDATRDGLRIALRR